jgi:hypothetical protein
MDYQAALVQPGQSPQMGFYLAEQAEQVGPAGPAAGWEALRQKLYEILDCRALKDNREPARDPSARRIATFKRRQKRQ